MYQVLTGTIVISVLHALIPSHWLPIIAIGRKEGWSMNAVMQVTFLSGFAHALSTILIGIFIGYIGIELSIHVEQFTKVIAPGLMIVLGLFFLWRHHIHLHFHLEMDRIQSKAKIIAPLVIAMFLSPCFEIEAYFLMAGALGWLMILTTALLYLIISISGMLIWVSFVYSRLLKTNWHSLEHNAGIITGITLILTGAISFFIS